MQLISTTQPKKWVFEIILERLPPFKWFPRGYNVAIQLLLMEIIGISVATFFALPLRSMVFGTSAILAVWIWSLLAIRMGPTVRKLEAPSAQLERDVIDNYRRSLFDSRRELSLGLVILLSLALYLFLERRLMVYWFDGNLSPILVALTAILLWDISYRLGLGLWSAVLAFRRSVSLTQVSRMRTKMRYTAYKELKTLKRLDLINLSFGAVTLLFYPLTSTNPVFFVALLMYSASISFFSAISYFTIDRIPGYPQEIIWLLNEGKFGYVGTSDQQMTPHLTPVIFVFDGRRAFFVVSKISKKLRNMKENAKIAFLVDMRDPNNLYNNRAVLLMGRAKVYKVSDAILRFSSLLRIRRLFRLKYPEYVGKYEAEQEHLPLAWRTTVFVSRMLVEIQVERMLYWREAQPIGLPLR
ncbi:MAG TPA: pyridoxamine 5'-phosphate oxidase family protein [Candidatus Bathyarchaeia archaeon]|nr:pyridoxamine 5'-phosphate oxidase family protein [Candidatus Bathyarchaeia archaeon]